MNSTCEIRKESAAVRLSRSASFRVIGLALAASVAGAAHAADSELIAAAGAETAAPAAAAAPASDDTVSTVVVTGYRKSVQEAVKIKKEATSVVESVTAEDVGKLPNTSITESLAQLPGVTAQRLAGRADVLSVRGFGPNFTGTLFNGREIATISDDRGFQYDQIPAELVNRGDVIKTPTADLIGQGLAGTVNMMTISPLAQGHRILNLSLRGEADAYSKEAPDVTNQGYRATLIYVDKFANDTVGVSLGASKLSTPQQEKQYQAWGFPTDANGNSLLGGAKFFATANLETRESEFGRIEWRPNDKFETSFDAFYSHFRTREEQRGLEVPLAWGSGPAATGITTVGGFDTQATFANVYSVQRNNFNGRNANTLALGWNTKYHFNDKLLLNVDLSYSRAHRHDYDLETYTGLGYNKTGASNTFTITQQPNGTFGIAGNLNYNNPSAFQLTDPQGWGYNGVNAVVQAGFLNAPDFVDELKTARASLEGDLAGTKFGGVFKGWELGANYGERTKTSSFHAYFLQPGPTFATTSLALPGSIVLPGVTPFNYLSGQTLAYNPIAAADLLTPVEDLRPASTTRDWVVDEKVLTTYGQLNIDTMVAEHSVRGNLGLQVVQTNQSSTGSSSAEVVTNGVGSIVAIPETGGVNYTYALPSLNLKADVAENTYAVFGVARSLSRPEQNYESVPFSYSGASSPNGTINGKPYYISGNGGNPKLKPYISDGVDFAVQRYFAHNSGLIELNFYYKSLTGYVDPNNFKIVDFSSVASSLLSPAAYAAANGFFQGVVTQPANTGKGDVTGIEAHLELPFGAFYHPLEGFGLRAQGGQTDSKIHFANGSPVTLPGLSKWTAVSTIFYEKYGFQARISYSYRSDFLGETSSVTQSSTLSPVKGDRLVDAQIGYEFQSGRLKGLSVVLQGKNLTDNAFVTYFSKDHRQIDQYEKYGSTYLLGLNYKF